MHENVPLLRVPDAGVVEPHPTAWSLSGAVSWQSAEATPDFASVNAMLHVTFCDAVETFTLPGTSEKVPSAGAIVSGSEVTVSIDGKPEVEGSSGAVFPTASVAVTLAVQTPAIA